MTRLLTNMEVSRLVKVLKTKGLTVESEADSRIVYDGKQKVFQTLKANGVWITRFMDSDNYKWGDYVESRFGNVPYVPNSNKGQIPVANNKPN